MWQYFTLPHTLRRSPPDSSGLQFVTRMSHTGVRWTPVDSAGLQYVFDGLRWTPPDSSGLQWTPVDSGGLRQTPLHFMLKYYQNMSLFITYSILIQIQI